MKIRALLLLLLIPAQADIHYFRHQRPVLNTPQAQLQTCVALDATMFEHASPQLMDLRLYRGTQETPFVLRTSASAMEEKRTIQPINLGRRNGRVAFDVFMPGGSYSDIELSLDAQDFIASVDVSGSNDSDAAQVTQLGSYTVFDLTRQKLGRSTVLHLPESNFRYLHFMLGDPLKPGNVSAIKLDRKPEHQPLYTTVAETTKIENHGQQSVIEFTLPANVPVDQLQFLLQPGDANFSRNVSVNIESEPGSKKLWEPVALNGNILRLHATRNSHRIDEEDLTVLAGGGTPFPEPTEWTVKVDNGDDPPIALSSVRLEMQQRTVCFDAQLGQTYSFYYGDSALAPPHYDYASLFELDKNAAAATLGPEQDNPDYQSRPDTRPFTEKHPALLWLALIAVILLLGAIALRTGKQLQQR